MVVQRIRAGYCSPACVRLALALALLTTVSEGIICAGVNRWTTHGPETAGVGYIAIDPRDSNHVFAAAGILFESRNGGADWSPTVGLSIGVGSVVFDPFDSSTLYAAGSDVFKSTDGGRTWSWASAGLAGPEIYPFLAFGLTVDPQAPSTLYAATNNGVFGSADAGCTWGQLTKPIPGGGALSVNSVTVDPTNSAVLYAGTQLTGAFKSVDGGVTWSSIDNGLTNPSIGTIAVDSGNPNRLYAPGQTFNDVTGQAGGAVFRSSDGGQSWIQLTNGLPDVPYLQVTVDPTNPGTVFATSPVAGIFKSTDGGDRWSWVGQGLTDPEVFDLVIAPGTSTTLFVGSEGGVFVSHDGGGSWAASNSGMIGFFGLTLVDDPATSGTLYAAGVGARAGVYKSTDRGDHWAEINEGLPMPTHVGSLAISRSDPSRIWAGTEAFSGVFVSGDGGASWHKSSSGLVEASVNDFAFDPANPLLLFAGTSHGVYRSLDGGASWTGVGPDYHAVSSLLLDASSAQTLYAVLEGSVETSLDSGDSWTPLSPLSGYYVLRLAQHPAYPALLFAGAISATPGNGILRSADGGVTWSPSGAGLPAIAVTSFAFDPDDALVIYAGSGSGVFVSDDGGDSWTPFNRGLQRGNDVRAISIAPDGTFLHAATSAGVYDYQFSPAPGPSVLAVSPGSGGPTGGTSIAITGQNFTPGAIVLVGGTAAGGVVVRSPVQITATTPAGNSGAADVTVRNPDSQFGGQPSGFVYEFLDVLPGDQFHDSIMAVARARLTAGCGDGNYCPLAPVSRSQAAVLIEKELHGPDFPYPPPGTSLLDVAPCDPAAQFIDEFLAEGITAGCGPTLYCPGSPVTRAQIAVFLLLAEHGPGYAPPAATGNVFQDVHPGDFAADFIEQLAHEGVTSGCGGGNYCSGASVSRGQVAALLARIFALS